MKLFESRAFHSGEDTSCNAYPFLEVTELWLLLDSSEQYRAIEIRRTCSLQAGCNPSPISGR